MTVLLLVVAGVSGSASFLGTPTKFLGDVGAPDVPQSVLSGGPVLGDGQPMPGARTRPGYLALTFDDGPSIYTPEILTVLEQNHVPATFFVSGDQIAGKTATLARMVAGGNEIGVLGFTHADFADMSAERQRLEVNVSRALVASATGLTTTLVRPPFFSTPALLLPAEYQAIKTPGSFQVVLADVDAYDFQAQGAAQLEASVMDQIRSGGIIEFHDGGGDRSATVGALSGIIRRLLAQGYRFGTVTQAIGSPPAMTAAGSSELFQGKVILAAVTASGWLLNAFQILFIVVALIGLARAVALIGFAAAHRQRHPRSPNDLPPHAGDEGPAPGPDATAVAVIVPAYNEEANIRTCLTSLLALHHSNLEIVVVDDGSTDQTAERVAALIAESGRPGLRLVCQPNQGKAAALNSGIKAVTAEILVLIDGDTILEPDAIAWLLQPFSDNSVGAVSGNTKVANRGFFGSCQHVEYVMGFNLDRRMYHLLGCMPTVPGAIGAFRRSALTQVGGVSTDTLAEDTDLTMAIVRAGWQVAYAERARAWTEAPGTFGQLWKQRYRWGFGTLQAMWKHRQAVTAPGTAGRLGRFTLPYLAVFGVLMPLAGPFMDMAAAASLFTTSSHTLLLTWGAFLGMQIIPAFYAFHLDKERFRILWLVPLHQLVYRQFLYTVAIHAAVNFLAGARPGWQNLHRTGVLHDRMNTITTGTSDPTLRDDVAGVGCRAGAGVVSCPGA